MNPKAQSAFTEALPSPARRTGTLFIVDDEMMVTASLQTMLTLETGHRIHCYNNPLEALEKVLTLLPDVVISDFSMPGMDGIHFLREVKRLLPEATLILLTGYADKENAIEAINTVGIYRYIEKPWDNEDLKISIANGLERSYLVGDLKQSVQDLTEARAELQQSNLNLEALVEERTRDLRDTYHKLHAIVQNTTDGILTLDAHLRLTSVNPAAESWLRAQQPLATVDLLSLPLDQLLTLQPCNGTPRTLQTLFHSETLRQAEEVFIGNIPLEASISPLNGPDPQEAKGFVVVLRDIAQRKEIERLRDDFMSTLTHDLRTPLLAAIQTLGFFADGTLGTLSPKQLELIQMLTQSNRELLGLVNVLLEVYKYESGRQKLILDTVSLKDLLGQITQELDALASHREHALSLSLLGDLSADGCKVWGDKQELKRVFVNLIGNAIHFTPKQGVIQVQIQINEAGQLQIDVVDNGRGIPATDIPRLFQRFSQGTSKQRSSGSGLGLYLSRQIVEAHHGQIGVESEEGAGSRFYVILPPIAATQGKLVTLPH
ncbi:ATP-binding protein [Vampirovibrio sp.]|uniref:sensor histidine kinase n=1 Tax=Vampirovibrio sp. TaxID=2717857 RepID=UPI0035930671